jgi:hypothetical protein
LNFRSGQDVPSLARAAKAFSDWLLDESLADFLLKSLTFTLHVDLVRQAFHSRWRNFWWFQEGSFIWKKLGSELHRIQSTRLSSRRFGNS